MFRKSIIIGIAATAFGLFAAAAQAQDIVKIGALLPMTGAQQSTGVQISAAIRLYQAQHGDTVAGKKIQVIVKDDGAVAETTKRLAQELIVKDKVNFVAGFGLTPTAFAVSPLATEAKDSTGRHGGRHVEHHRALSLRRSYQLHAGAIMRDHGRMGAQE